MPLDQPSRELLRDKILARLSRRQAFSYTADAIARALRDRALVDFDPDLADVESACVFLAGTGWLTSTPHPAGSTRLYQATSAGVLEAERRGLRE